MISAFSPRFFPKTIPSKLRMLSNLPLLYDGAREKPRERTSYASTGRCAGRRRMKASVFCRRRVPDREWYDSGMKFPRTDKELKELKDRLARKKRGPDEITRGTGKTPDEFWTMPRPKISEGAALKALLDDREEGR